MRTRGPRRNGFTFVELLVVTAILAILAAAIIPLAKIEVKRGREVELRRSLRLMREAIDAYKRLADEKRIEIEDEDQDGYPPTLEELVKGVEVQAAAEEAQEGEEGGEESSAEPKLVKFLRRIPIDPMTGTTDWGLLSTQDKPDADSWGEENVFDVYTKSRATALDGTKYRDW
jgi:general secretion pathway protein G